MNTSKPAWVCVVTRLAYRALMGWCPPAAVSENGAAFRLCEAVDEGAVFDGLPPVPDRFKNRVRRASRFLMMGLF